MSPEARHLRVSSGIVLLATIAIFIFITLCQGRVADNPRLWWFLAAGAWSLLAVAFVFKWLHRRMIFSSFVMLGLVIISAHVVLPNADLLLFALTGVAAVGLAIFSLHKYNSTEPDEKL